MVFINDDLYRKYDSYQLTYEGHFGFADNQAVMSLLDVREPFLDIVTKWVRYCNRLTFELVNSYNESKESRDSE